MIYKLDVLFPQSIDQSFSYFYKTKSTLNLVGFRILVPFGRQLKVAIVIKQSLNINTNDYSLKEVEKIIDSKAFLAQNLIKIIEFISSYYLVTRGDILRFLLPTGTIPQIVKKISLVNEISFDDMKKIVGHSSVKYKILKLLKPFQKKEIAYAQLEENIGKTIQSQISNLISDGIINITYDLISAKVTEKMLEYVLPEINNEKALQLKKNAVEQFKILEFLKKHSKKISKIDLIQNYQFSRSALNTLLTKKVIRSVHEEYERKFPQQFENESQSFSLTDEQANAFNKIKSTLHTYSTFLLHGITGSGKTLLYIKIVSEIIQNNKTAIILIPEISLTPQTVARFRSQFGNLITILNSQMSAGERYDAWRFIRDGKYKIVIGPRSAIFAPLENIGIIIVDEEHESSYKQTDQSPRYSARDIAVYRGKCENCPVILGSATPSLESYYNAMQGKYHLLELKNRPLNAVLPTIEIIDLKEELRLFPSKDNIILSTTLENAIEQCIMKKEQIILFQNKRGYSSYLNCNLCGHAQECPSCSISLVFHKHENLLKCHYCGFKSNVFSMCQKCNKSKLMASGFGTQKVEEYLYQRFPNIRILRMDYDTTRERNSHQLILQKFRDEKADILIGTQMIAKGLDFPNVTLVGVLSADSSLNIPDFRSSERTFQLLSQVAGRSGRAQKRGHVIIQSFQPEHYSITGTLKNNYKSFYETEISYRKASDYPPVARLINIKFMDNDKNKLFHASLNFKQKLDSFHDNGIIILGPVPCIIEKIKNDFRWQLLIKISPHYQKLKSLKFHLNEILKSVRKSNPIRRLIIDIDPHDLT